MRRVQWAILPVALLVSLILPSVTEPIEFIFSSSHRGLNVKLTPVRSIGRRTGVAALCFDSTPVTEGQTTIAVSQGLRCFLFRSNETPIVWLDSYRLKSIRVYESATPSIVLELEEGGQGEAYALSGLTPGSEVYVLLRRNGVATFEYLFRVVESEALIEIYGSAKGATKVTAFAYAAAEDFNASHPPPASLYVTESEVVDGRFLLRIEKGGAPFTRQGRPLIEVNSTLVLHTECSYGVIDLTDYLASDRGVRLTVNLDCKESSETRTP
ncbi:MAG: hypothetical protein QXP94_04690 [Thermofilaceae archaeon]